MKKKIFIGVLAFIISIGIGATAYVTYAQPGNFPLGMNPSAQEEMRAALGQVGFDYEEMVNLMTSNEKTNDMLQYMNQEEMFNIMSEQNINYGQMLPYIEQMHPDLNNEEARELYQSMHGTQGSSNSANFNIDGMMYR